MWLDAPWVSALAAAGSAMATGSRHWNSFSDHKSSASSRRAGNQSRADRAPVAPRTARRSPQSPRIANTASTARRESIYPSARTSRRTTADSTVSTVDRSRGDWDWDRQATSHGEAA